MRSAIHMDDFIMLYGWPVSVSWRFIRCLWREFLDRGVVVGWFDIRDRGTCGWLVGKSPNAPIANL
jgi:hypothetical protein